MTTTIYIHPAYTDQAGQCRIYATNGLGDLNAAIDYMVRPNLWREVGLMNSRGELVCFDGPSEWRQRKFQDRTYPGHHHQLGQLPANIAQDARDAARYRKLRAQHWSASKLAVVLNPKQNLRLGAFCPSGDILDEYVDKLPDPQPKRD